jgi:sugar/nucleoside kinase (ribokinase family)
LANKTIYLKKFFDMYKILGIGNALVDVMTLLKDEKLLQRFSLPKGSMQLVDLEKSEKIKNETSDLQKSHSSGGSAANTIHGLAMLGIQTGFIGSVGKDSTGDFFENDMRKAGIATMLTRRDSVTGTAVALISPDSERTFATHLGAAVELNADDLAEPDFTGYDILYLEGYLIINKQLVETACRYARSKHMKVALDLASYNVVEARLQDLKEITEKYVDIIFANELEAKAYTSLAPLEALNSLSDSCEVAVVKTGAEGSWVKSGSEIFKIGPEKVDVTDTTGAGDLYASGFLYGYASGKSLETCGRYGSFLAGKVIGIVGARISTEKWEEIKRQINLI